MMTGLLLATGFTGALTLVFLVHLVRGRFGACSAVEAHFSPGDCLEPVVRQVRRARRQVQLLAGSLSSSALSQALVDAKLRGVQVEIVLDAACAADPASDFAFLVDQKLAPTVRDRAEPPLKQCLLLVDGETVTTGSFAFTQEAEEKHASLLLILAGQAKLAQLCARQFVEQRARSRTIESPTTPEKPIARMPAPAGTASADARPRLRLLAEEPTPASS